MKMMVKQECDLSMQDGKRQMIFTHHVLLPGADIWKAFANIARREKEKPLVGKVTENNHPW